VLCVSAESLNKGFTIIIDNRLGNLTTSVKKLLSAAEVDQTFLQQKHLSYIVFYSSTFARLQGNQIKCRKKRLFYFTFISAFELLKPHRYKHNHCFTAITRHLVDTSACTCGDKGGLLQLSSLGYFRTTVTTAAVCL